MGWSPFQSKEKKQRIDAARTAFDQFAFAAASSEPAEARALAVTFKENPNLEVLSWPERRQRSGKALRAYAQAVLRDDRMTPEEEVAFQEVVSALGISQDAFATTYCDLLCRLTVAKANDGRLGVIKSPHMTPKAGEIVHLETEAGLMKEVSVREWQGGSAGFSFRVASGVTYRTGAIRGRSVEVGLTGPRFSVRSLWEVWLGVGLSFSCVLGRCHVAE